jgi:hypothetical protein
MPMMITTIMISIRVKPHVSFSRVCFPHSGQWAGKTKANAAIIVERSATQSDERCTVHQWRTSGSAGIASGA